MAVTSIRAFSLSILMVMILTIYSGVAMRWICFNGKSILIHGMAWCPMTIIQYIPRNMHTVIALLCFVVVIHLLIFPYPSGLLHWHCGNLTIAPVPAKQPWWIWINTSCEFIMNDCITTTKQSTTKPCAYFLGYTVVNNNGQGHLFLYNTLWCALQRLICNFRAYKMFNVTLIP